MLYMNLSLCELIISILFINLLEKGLTKNFTLPLKKNSKKGLQLTFGK